MTSYTRLSLTDLLPSTDYAIRIRAIGTNGAYSNWSTRHLFTTVSDHIPPATPTNPTWVAVGDAFHGEWDSVSKNISGDTITITRYEVEVTADGIVIINSVPPVTGASKNSFDLSYETNVAIFFTVQPLVTFRVRAVDNKDNKSDWTDLLTAGNPPPKPPTNVVAKAAIDSIILTWNAPVDEDDMTGYNIYSSGGAKVGFINGTTFTYTTTTYSPQVLSVCTTDKFGQESTKVAANAVTPISPFLVDVTGPDDPSWGSTSITNNANGVGAILSLSWTQNVPSPDDLRAFEIRYRQTGTSVWTSGGSFDKATRSANVQVPTAYVGYDVGIRSSDTSANYNPSGWITTSIAAVANAIPANVTGLTSSPGKDSITYSWTAVADLDIKNYELTFSTSSTFASGNTTYLTGTSTSVTIGGLSPSTTYYARVRAVDQGGLTSAAWSATNTTATTAFPVTALSDGKVPGTGPTPTLTSGLGNLNITWSPVTVNATGGSQLDLVTYEVHISTTSGFATSSSTKAGETAGTGYVLENDATGTALAYGTDYYVRIIPKDRDGSGAVGAQAGPKRIGQVGASDSTLTAGDVGAPTVGQLTTTNINVSTAQATANLKNSTFVQSTTPTATKVNDIWVDTGNGNVIKTWNGSTWSLAQDTAITAALTSGASLIQDGGFEYGTLGKSLASANSTIVTGDSTALTGTAYGRIANNEAYPGISFNVSLRSERRYRVQFYARVPSSSASTSVYSRVNLQNPDGGNNWPAISQNVTNNNTWTKYTYDFDTTGLKNLITTLWIQGNNDGSVIHIDDVNIYDITEAYLAQTTATSAQTTANGKNSVFVQATAPVATKVNDIWVDTSNGNVLRVWDGSAWISRPDAAIATAQSTANGKNTVTYSAVAPTNQSNTAGDIWFVRNTGTGIISAQYEGLGGTSWAVKTMASSVIANLDVGKLTTGTLGAIDINIGTGGIIHSNDYVAGTTGWKLGTGGLEINDGTIRARALNVTIGGENILVDSSMEVSGTVYYVSSAVTATTSAAGRVAGKALGAQRINNGDGYILTHGTTPFSKYQGKRLMLSWYSYSSAAGQAVTNPAIQSNYYIGVTFANGGQQFSTTTGWTRFSGYVDVPSDMTDGHLVLRPVGNGTDNTTIVYYDDLMLEVGDVATAYSPKSDEILPGTITGNMLQANTAVVTTLNINSGGVIQSTGYNGTSGFQISDTAITIKNGFINANTLVAGTGIVNNLIINTGGAIQSANFNGIGGTAGFFIGTTGIVMNDASSSVKVDAIKTGTLGASGAVAIQVTNGTSLVFNAGHLRSNTYQNSGGTQLTSYQPASATAGWYLGNDGLVIVNGAISASALSIGGTITSGNIMLNGGSIQSLNYNGSSGFRLTNSGLEVPNGSIQAATLNIFPGGQNIITNSGFENPTNYITGWNYTGGNAKETTLVYYGSSASVAISQSGQCVYRDYTGLPVGKNYVFSAWVYNDGWTSGLKSYLVIHDTTGANLVTGAGGSNPSALSVGTGVWERIYLKYTVPANGKMRIHVYSGATGRAIIDNVQLEQSDFMTGYAPVPGETTGYTTIDGAMIKTGSIQSTALLNVSGNNYPAWSINMGGYASFAGAQILGNTVLGFNSSYSGDSSQIASANYIAGSTGWRVTNNTGYAEFNNVTVRGNIQASNIDASSTINGSIIIGATYSTRTNVGQAGVTGISIDGSNGLRAYSSGTNTFTIDLSGNLTTSGNVTVSGTGYIYLSNGGTIASKNSSGSGITLKDDGSGGVLLFNTGFSDYTAGRINPYNTGGNGGIYIAPPKINSAHTVPYMNIVSGYSDYIAANTTLFAITGNMKSAGVVTDTVSNNASNAILFSVPNGSLILSGGTNIAARLSPSVGGTSLIFRSNFIAACIDTMNNTTATSANTVDFYANTLRSFAGVYDTSYISQPTVVFNSLGRIVGSGSSRRYKHDISPMNLNTAKKALGLETVTFRYNEDRDLGNDLYPGVIAEQALEAGLDLWVTRDEKNKPNGFRYSELSVAHNMLIKDLYNENKDLKEQVTDLSDRLANLEQLVKKLVK